MTYQNYKSTPWLLSWLETHIQPALSFLKNGPSPASFSFIFVFSNKNYNFYNKQMKNVHPVVRARIQTHDFQHTRLLS